jgi:hypothetical protein
LAGIFSPQFVSAGIFLFRITLQEFFFQNHPPPALKVKWSAPKVVLEQSGKVEYERERLLGIAMKIH